MNIFGVKNMKNGNLGPVSREKMQLKKFQVEEYYKQKFLKLCRKLYEKKLKS